MKFINEVEVEVDLSTIPLAKWPTEAKEMARCILSSKKMESEFYAQLPGEMRVYWLISKIESRIKAGRELFAEFGK